MTEKRVVVIGGGLAGVTAALDCAGEGAEVTLLESRGRLGGAAYSFMRDGLRVDNGQHVFLRCCTAYRELLKRSGADGMVTLQPRLRIPIVGPDGRQYVLQRSDAPAPLQLAGALARYRLLSVADRLAVARAMTALRRIDPNDPATDLRAFGDWLTEQGQSATAMAAIWELIARPTLNLLPADASLAQAAQVFQVGLLQHCTAGDIGWARVPLSEIHDVALRRTLARAGVDVGLRKGVTAVVCDRGGFQIEISGSPTLRADAVVLAVPPDRAARLTPPETGIDASRVLRLGSSPIVNLHVVYDRPVFHAPFAAAVGSPVQWIFDRTESSGAAGGQYLVVSLSAADDEVSSSVEDLRARYLPALGALLDDSAKVENFFVTREHAATFRAAPGTRGLRPSATTKLAGFALAGSWTNTGWPATMEGAVRSGHAAARVALESLAGRPPRRAAKRARTEQSGVRSPELTILAPMALEAKALRSGAPWARVERIGAGPAFAAAKVKAVVDRGAHPVLVAGVCGAIDERLEPGDVVLGTELQATNGSFPCPDPTVLANVLRGGGLRVWTGPVASSKRVVAGAARARMMTTGALAVDMESAFVPTLVGRPVPVMRVVLDTPRSELYRPLRTARGTAQAYRTLRRAAALLVDWARILGPREVILATPRASCAGVERAVQVVERTLEQDGPPVYVRKQIVHNSHVIRDLESRGAVFVDEVEQVPPGATVIFSAHGVAPHVWTRARERGLRVVDATCPLVSKVHAEARRFRDRGYDIVLVGHEGHEEVEGTLGQAPERTHIIAGVDEVEQLHVDDPERVAYLTQTTLALDDTADVVEALRGRFPGLVGPRSSDICYATQNRQDAVRAVAAECDLLLVIGSKNSSNSQRLVEVAGRAGARAVLIEDGGDLSPALLGGARRIGVSAGASAPERLVGELVEVLSGLGEVTVSDRRVAREDIHFKLPVSVRGRD